MARSLPDQQLSALQRLRRGGAMLALSLVLASCQAPTGWKIYPLSRREPHDGLAVVNQPDGYGLHIWIDTDTRTPGECKPRWAGDAARLFNGNGSAPFSSGLASRQELFAAASRWDVRRRLRQESEALCKQRAPQASFVWNAPPRNESEVVVETLPPLKEKDLLLDPSKVRQEEEQLMQGEPPELSRPR
jgi:hypothetical protein